MIALTACETTQGGLQVAAAGHTFQTNSNAAFHIGVIPTSPPPIALGQALGFRLSSSASGYAHLYLLNASGTVMVLAENMPVAQGVETFYPDPAQNLTLRASPPVGRERVVLLVTRAPVRGVRAGHGPNHHASHGPRHQGPGFHPAGERRDGGAAASAMVADRDLAHHLRPEGAVVTRRRPRGPIPPRSSIEHGIRAMTRIFRKTLSGMTALVAATALAVAATGGATAAEKGSKPSTRDLTVEQNAIFAVQSTQPATASGLTVTAWVDHYDNTYAVGEKVRLFVQTNKPAYVTVLNIGASGNTTVLFPNQYQSNNLIPANQAVEVPAPTSPARITVAPPTGTELIKVIASTTPTPLIAAANLTPAGPFQQVKGTGRSIARDLQVSLGATQTGIGATQTGIGGTREWDDYNKVIHTVAMRPQVPGMVATMPGLPATMPGMPATVPGMPVTMPGLPATMPGLPATVPGQPAGVLPAFAALTGMTSSARATTIHIATDKPVYRIGEPVQVAVRSDKTCHLTLVNFLSSGQTRVLFPNRYQQNNLLQAGQTLVLPGQASGLAIQVSGPAGPENVVAVCSAENRPVFGRGYDFTQVFPSVGTRSKVMRDLSVVVNRPAAEWAQAVASFLVVP